MIDINNIDESHGDKSHAPTVTQKEIDYALTDDDLVADAIDEMKLFIDDLNAKGNGIYNFLHSTNSDDLAHELREVGRSLVKHRLIKEHPANRG